MNKTSTGFYYVYSTLTCNQLYGAFAPGGADVATQPDKVLIYGGAGITDDRLVTPRGVATRITEAQEAILRACPMFKFHSKGGYVHIDEDDMDADSMSESMSIDPGAPLVEKDFASDDPDDKNAVVVTTNETDNGAPGKVGRTARKTKVKK